MGKGGRVSREGRREGGSFGMVVGRGRLVGRVSGGGW